MIENGNRGWGGNMIRTKIERNEKDRTKSMNSIVDNKKFGNKEYREVTYKKLILLRLTNIYKKQEA